MSFAVTTFMPEEFNKSIELALRRIPSKEEPVARIQHIINSLPDGKLYVSNRRKDTVFYIKVEGHHQYLPKKSELVYLLARKKYLTLLLQILELSDSRNPKEIQKRRELIKRLQKLITDFGRGRLELARIVLTQKQYRWLTSQFEQKYIDKAKALRTQKGLHVRSKSERDIINTCDSLAVPHHYEERQFIYVKPLVDKLEEELREMGWNIYPVCKFGSGGTRWNVPSQLEVMNAKGSVWRSYYPPKGTIKLYNDIRIMLADGSFFVWEHEGLMAHFTYRYNAAERTAVMKFTETVDTGHLLETYERDIETPEKRIDIIERSILPRLWF